MDIKILQILIRSPAFREMTANEKTVGYGRQIICPLVCSISNDRPNQTHSELRRYVGLEVSYRPVALRLLSVLSCI